MADAIYPKAKENFLEGSLDWDAHNFKVTLIDKANYTYSTSHEFLTSVSASARVDTSTGNLASKTTVGGVADAADIVISSVSGSTVDGLIIFRDSGSSGTSQLVAYFDSTSGTNLPLSVAGGDVTVTWSTSGIFAL